MKNINRASDNVKYYHSHGNDSDTLVNTLANDLSYEFFRAGMDRDSEKIAKMASILDDKQTPLNSMAEFLPVCETGGAVDDRS